MKKLTSAVVASSLVFGAVSTALAAPAADEVNTAFARLSHYNVVQGIALPDGTVTPGLDQTLTRAQLLTIVVRAFGQEENGKLLRGATTGYSDVDGNADAEWATGYIFVGQRLAAQKGITIGLPGNLFAPAKNVSKIEALAFIMKFLGIEVGSGDTWVADTIANAKAAGLLTDADVQKYLDNPGADASRGDAFALMDNIFLTYNKLEGGKTVYTTYVDENAPELHVDAPALTTDKETITITGHTVDAAELYLGSEKIAVNEDGSFSVEVALNVGENAIAFTAVDLAGNPTEATYTVTRNPGAAAKITASLASSIEAGTTAELEYEITDANGVVLEIPASELTVTVGGNIGTYADGAFTASEKAGTGTVTVSYGDLTPATIDVTVSAGPLAKLLVDKASVAKGETIKLTPADQYGNAIASGVSYTWEGTGIAVTNAGVVYTSAPGKYNVTATAGEATAAVSVGVYNAAASAIQVSTADSIVANGSSRVKVTLNAADEFGNTVGNYASQLTLGGTLVTFYADETSSTPITTVTPKDGVATVYAVVATAMSGEQVTITAHQTSASTIKGEAKLSAVAPVASNLKVTTGSKTMAANQSTTESFAVKVVDQAGVEVVGVYTVTAEVTGPAKLSTSKTAFYSKASGSAATPASFTVSNAEFVGAEGTITGTFTVEGIGSATASISHVIAGNPAKLALVTDKETLASESGAKFKYTVELQDRNGVALAAPALTNLTISMPDDYEGKFRVLAADGTTVVTPAQDGTWTVSLASGAKTADFYVEVFGKYTGNVAVAVKGTVSGVEVTGSKTVSVTTGTAKGVALDRDGVVYAPVAAPTATFTASMADHFGNTVAAADVELSVYAVEGSSAANITVNGKNATAADPLLVKTNAEGKAVLELVARPYSNHTYNLVVSYTKDSVTTTDTVSLGITNQVAASLTTKIYKAVPNTATFFQPNTVKAGEEFYMVVSAKDNYGGPIDLTGLKLTAPAGTISLDGTTLANETAIGSASFNAYNAQGTPAGLNLQSGDHWIKVYGGKAGIASLGAKYEALQTALTTSANVAVQAGALNKIVANGGKAIEVKGISTVHGPYTLSLVDAFGNTVPLTVNTSITASAPAAVSFRTEAGGATVTSFTTNSTTAFYFVATAAGNHTATFSTSVDTDGNGTPETYSGTATLTVTQ
ncbi:MAG: hypothetical protein ACOY93_15975 [Bacillota bacterium]